jgi:[acyl-carrier-protein] S-malonyltransferase
VERVLAIVCPGQGAQAPGLLAPWLELPTCRNRMEWFTTVAGIDLLEHGTESDADTIRDTAIAQPLIVASGLAALLELFPKPSRGFSQVSVGAGHSVGEITAAAATGVITAEQALVFVRERGRQMAIASQAQPTGMTAVIGGDPEQVRAALDEHGLTAANVNALGQVVAAGTKTQLDALAADPPAKVRLIPLHVAGAFHTDHMSPAVARLAAYATARTTREAHTRLVSNRDGHVVRSGREVLDRLVSQVSSPVRWDLCMQTLMDLGVTGLIEVPPAGTLVGLAKRAMPGVELLALKSPQDLDRARAGDRELLRPRLRVQRGHQQLRAGTQPAGPVQHRQVRGEQHPRTADHTDRPGRRPGRVGRLGTRDREAGR